jgi:hypothetical protein
MIDINGALCSISEVFKLVEAYSDRLSDNAVYGALSRQSDRIGEFADAQLTTSGQQ